MSRARYWLACVLPGLCLAAGCVAHPGAHQDFWPELKATATFNKPGPGKISIRLRAPRETGGWQTAGMSVSGKQSWKRPERLADDDLIFATLGPEGEPWTDLQADSFDTTGGVPYWLIVEVYLRQERHFKTRWFTARFDCRTDGAQDQTLSPIRGSGRSWLDAGEFLPPTTSNVYFGGLGNVTVDIFGPTKQPHAKGVFLLKPFSIRKEPPPTQGSNFDTMGPARIVFYRDGKWDVMGLKTTWDLKVTPCFLVVTRTSSVIGSGKQWMYSSHQPAPDTCSKNKGFTEF